MTQVLIKAEKSAKCIEIISEGHSGYASEGEDIVCAALSSAAELVLDIFDKFCVCFDMDSNEEIPRIKLKIPLDGQNSAQAENIRRIVAGYSQFVTDLAESYPEYTQVITEV